MIPWLFFRSFDLVFLLYSVFTLLIFLIATLPEIRAYSIHVKEKNLELYNKEKNDIKVLQTNAISIFFKKFNATNQPINLFVSLYLDPSLKGIQSKLLSKLQNQACLQMHCKSNMLQGVSQHNYGQSEPSYCIIFALD